MKIIGIGGTNGSGKDTLSEILAQDHGWLFVSTSRDLLIPELKKRGLPIERENMANLTKEWRSQSPGQSVVVRKAVEKFEQENVDHKYNGLVISSLRHPWEVDEVHRIGGKIVWVDADPKLRYDRIYNRGQGAKDQKTFDQFLAEEQAEMQYRDGDETTLNMGNVKAKADIFINNDSNNLEDFKRIVKKELLGYNI